MVAQAHFLRERSGGRACWGHVAPLAAAVRPAVGSGLLDFFPSSFAGDVRGAPVRSSHMLVPLTFPVTVSRSMWRPPKKERHGLSAQDLVGHIRTRALTPRRSTKILRSDVHTSRRPPPLPHPAAHASAGLRNNSTNFTFPSALPAPRLRGGVHPQQNQHPTNLQYSVPVARPASMPTGNQAPPPCT